MKRPTPKMLRECANILETAPYCRTETAAWLRATADRDEKNAKEARAFAVSLYRIAQDLKKTLEANK